MGPFGYIASENFKTTSGLELVSARCNLTGFRLPHFEELRLDKGAYYLRLRGWLSWGSWLKAPDLGL